MNEYRSETIKGIPVVIPSYEPDEQLVELCEALVTSGITDICIVDDGSGEEYRSIFDRIETTYADENVRILRHSVNMGKGRALKTAFQDLLEHRQGLIGCVTADSDGQHTPKDIYRCMQELAGHPDSLIMGCRRFDGEDVPLKSRYGNELTRSVCQYLCGINVSDTQTGLRGIPAAFMKHLLNVPGDRFEFETRMLIECRDRVDILEIPIETVYDSKENHRTHFDPIKDSIRIYKIFGVMFLKYVFSSLSSCVIDLILFAFFCKLLRGGGGSWYVMAATVAARVISAVYNYLINYRFVFRSNKSYSGSAMRYAMLAIIQMCASALLVTGGVMLFRGVSETLIKVVVDGCLFFISYYVQRKVVF